MKKKLFVATVSAAIFATNLLLAEEKAQSPAEGYNIHVVAPHRHEDGTVHGPYLAVHDLPVHRSQGRTRRD
jgi:hypothetical protein